MRYDLRPFLYYTNLREKMIHLTKFLKRYIMIILNGAESSNFYNHIKEKHS